MRKYFVGVLCASVLALAVVAPVAKAQTAATTPTIASLMVILQGLLKQVEELQRNLPNSQGEIKAGLREGMTDVDVRKIQELLASDPTLYPRGLITGYYGPLTSEAIKQFQNRNGLAVTGVIDEVTREYLEEYYAEYKANPGAAALWALSNRDVIKQRIEERKKEQEVKIEERNEYRNADDSEDEDVVDAYWDDEVDMGDEAPSEVSPL